MPTATLFQLLGTQWRVIAIPMGGIYHQGIDYGSIAEPLRALGIRNTERADVFAGLRIMEAAALPILNERKDGG